MIKANNLTPFEWEIMKLIWKSHPRTVRQVVDALPSEYQRAYTTVQTYVERLVEKGFLNKKKDGKINIYAPAVAEEPVREREIARVVQKAFDGSFGSLAAYLVKSRRLNEEELNELFELINDEQGRDEK